MKYAMVMTMQTSTLKKYQFPVRDSSRYQLLVDGVNYFRRMQAIIDEANDYILLEQYLTTSGTISNRFIEHLCLAAKRGVAVYVLLDDFGSTGLALPDRTKLVKAGIKLCMYNPVRFKRFFNSLFRNHRKCLVIDNQFAFVGGAGLADEFSEDTYGLQAWHDVMLEIQGTAVQDWSELFVQTWRKHSDLAIDITSESKPVKDKNQVGRLLISAPFKRQEIKRALIKQLRRAQHHAWITSPYFVAPRRIRRTLRQTARRGVDVRLLLPGQHSDHPWISYAARRHYMRLLRSGVRIFEYQPRFIHAKIELCDNWVSLGSSNLDRWNQHWNLDANQEVCDREFAHEIKQLFLNDFADSLEITLAYWQKRPLFTRIRETLSGQIIYWIERFLRS